MPLWHYLARRMWSPSLCSEPEANRNQEEDVARERRSLVEGGPVREAGGRAKDWTFHCDREEVGPCEA